METKIQKKFFVDAINGSELLALNCLYLEENTFNQQSIC